MKLVVTFLDATEETATIIPGDTALFERKYDISVEEADAHPRVEHTLFLAYTALARVGKAHAADFDAFMQTVEDVNPDALTQALGEQAEAKQAVAKDASPENQAALVAAQEKVAAAKVPLAQ